MSCLILGDSLAVGLASVLKGCTVIAKVGVTSLWILAHAHSGSFNTVYISSGTNDVPNGTHIVTIVKHLEATRAKNPQAITYWVASQLQPARAAEYNVASNHHDKVLTCKRGGWGNFHCKNYRELLQR
jgi:hypothetical protein